MKGLKTNYSYVLLFLLAVLLPTNAAAQSYRTRGGEILNCFGWSYNQIIRHLEDIKKAEFSAIQVSSVQPMLPKDTKELWYTVGGEKQGVTIYVKKDRDTAPYLYANTTKWEQLSGAWPGKQMYKTCTIGGQDYWYETFKVDGLNIIFNDGPNQPQTKDITNVTSDTFYRLDTDTGADGKYACETLSGITAPTKHVSVYAKATEAPHLYVWGNDINYNGNMPGAKMWKTENIDGTDYYYDSFAAETINYSFNDGGTNKTADFTNITATKYYEVQKSGTFESGITTYAATELTGINEPSNVYAPSWAFIYEPLGIRMADNLLGTVDEFKLLVTNAHAQGLGVVVGVEANSVSNKEDKLDDNITKYLRKDYDGTEDWDMEDREWITHHNVNVHTGVNYTYDLKTENTELQAIVKSFLDDLETAGVDGICWYHAKYIGVEQGHSYFNVAKGVPENTDLSHNNLERDTFWENICNYWWTEKGKWCYGEIGADPFYKGNTDDPNHFECKWSHEDGYSRIVREYIFQMDLADAFYAKKNFTDGGCSWANGYWEAQTAEQAKLRKSMTITEFLDNKKTAGKSDLVYYAENADTYMQIWPEING